MSITENRFTEPIQGWHRDDPSRTINSLVNLFIFNFKKDYFYV